MTSLLCPRCAPADGDAGALRQAPSSDASAAPPISAPLRRSSARRVSPDEWRDPLGSRNRCIGVFAKLAWSRDTVERSCWSVKAGVLLARGDYLAAAGRSCALAVTGSV